MLDQWGKEIGGPSIEQRVKDLEAGFAEIVNAVVKIQQRLYSILNKASISDARNFDKGEVTDGVQQQSSGDTEGTDEEFDSGETGAEGDTDE